MLQMLLLLALIWEGYLCQIARYEVQKQPDVTVLEGMCARVPCNISSPLEHIPKVSPGYGYWFRKGKYKYDKLVATNDPNREIEAEVQVRFHLLGNPGMANCSLNIPKARKADSGQYYFWMKREGQVNSTHLKLLVYVNVTDAVQNVTITVALDNRTTGFVPGNSSVLVVQEGRSLHLLCAANSNPPATLSWILGDQTLISSQPSEDGVLHLDLPHLGPADGGNYTCLAQHPLGSKQASLRVSVQYSPRIISPSCFWLKEGLICTCSVQAEPAPSLLWWVEGKPVEDNSSSDTFQVTSSRSESWANSSLRVKVDRVPNITVSCEGKNPQGIHTLFFQLVPDRPTPSHVFPQGMILGVLCGAGATSLLALCLLLVQMLRKKSVEAAAAEATKGAVEDPKRPSRVDLSLNPISPAADTAPTPAAPEDGLDDLHYTCLNFQAGKAREDHGSTDPLNEYSEIKFQ